MTIPSLTTSIPNPLAPPGRSVSQVSEGSCLVLSDRPLTARVHPTQFPTDELSEALYSSGPLLQFTDGETDDQANWLFTAGPNTLFVSEQHREIKNVPTLLADLIAKTKTNARVEGALCLSDPIAQEASLARIIEHIRSLPDHSLRIQVNAPCTTLAALIERAPDLLAKKIKRITMLGGFAYRKCENERFNGSSVYYTTFNLSENLEASRKVFAFVQERNVPTYILATDSLRLSRKHNFDLAHKVNEMAPTFPAAQAVAGFNMDWNRSSFAKWGDAEVEKIKKMARDAGYEPDEYLSNNMTPADAISGVFDLAFDDPRFRIETNTFADLQITDEPRYEEGKPSKKHRAVTLTDRGPAAGGPIHYVKGFSFQGFSTDQSFSILLNHLLNIAWNKSWQLNQGNTMSTNSISLSTAAPPRTPFAEEHKGAPVTASAAAPAPVAAASSQAPVVAGPPVALPQSYSLKETMAMCGPAGLPALVAKFATPAEIKEASRDFFALKLLFEQHVAAEYAAYIDLVSRGTDLDSAEKHAYNYELREQFEEAFQALQDKLNGRLNDLDASPLSGADKAIVKTFATSGNGAETLRTFAKIPLPVALDDKEYGSKMLAFTRNCLRFRSADVVPGLGITLAQTGAKDKTEIPVQGGLFLKRRMDHRQQVIADSIVISQTVSDHLVNKLPQSADGHPTQHFTYGPIGAGKSTLLHALFGLTDTDVFSPDELKKRYFNGNLGHLEAAGVGDLIRARLEEMNLPHQIDPRTNVRKRVVDEIVKPKPGLHKCVYDIYATPETAKQRMIARAATGVRVSSDNEITESCSEAAKNRPLLVKAAKEGVLTWSLYDNDTTPMAVYDSAMAEPAAKRGPVLVARIENKVLRVFDQVRYDAICAKDAALSSAITA